jgi:hypothetical protein
LEANWEITGYTSIFFRYPFIGTFFFKSYPSERSKSSGIYSGVFDTSSAVWSIVFPIPGCGVARSRFEASVLALVGCH